MRKSKFLFMLLSLMMVSATALAQKVTYTGVVVDDLNEPVIGASVVQKGTSNGAVTDFDGNFSVTVDEGATLVISYIGYVTQEVKAANNLRIMLQSDQKTLDEVVVIGYGVQKKSVVTASIAKVSADDLDGKTRLRAEDALKGMAAGVQVTSASGQPGAKSMIRIRGIGTINGSASPLYVLDGVPYSGNISDLNPADIESMTVLKDAASAALYGNRASNGVILITTKKGSQGRLSVSLDIKHRPGRRVRLFHRTCHLGHPGSRL